MDSREAGVDDGSVNAAIFDTVEGATGSDVGFVDTTEPAAAGHS